MEEIWDIFFNGRESEWFDVFKGKDTERSMSIVNDVIFEHKGFEKDEWAERIVERIDDWWHEHFCHYCGNEKESDQDYCSIRCREYHRTEMIEERV